VKVGDYIIIKDNIVEERIKFTYETGNFVMHQIIGEQFKIIKVLEDSVRIEGYVSYFIPKSAITTIKEIRILKMKEIFNG